MKRATKAELRQEICELRHVGRQMANACFNLGQGHTFTQYDRDICDGLRREWDAIKRRENRDAK